MIYRKSTISLGNGPVERPRKGLTLLLIGEGPSRASAVRLPLPSRRFQAMFGDDQQVNQRRSGRM
jgi:hypothetical protein